MDWIMGTSVRRRERPALNRGSISKGGIVPSSSQKRMTRFFSLPPFSSATAKSSRERFWIINPAMKFFVVSSSGRMRKMADFSAANISASMALSKHRICSSSESRKEFSRDNTVDMTEAIACSELLSAAPASQRALCSEGSLSMST